MPGTPNIRGAARSRPARNVNAGPYDLVGSGAPGTVSSDSSGQTPAVQPAPADQPMVQQTYDSGVSQTNQSQVNMEQQQHNLLLQQQQNMLLQQQQQQNIILCNSSRKSTTNVTQAMLLRSVASIA